MAGLRNINSVPDIILLMFEWIPLSRFLRKRRDARSAGHTIWLPLSSARHDYADGSSSLRAVLLQQTSF